MLVWRYLEICLLSSVMSMVVCIVETLFGKSVKILLESLAFGTCLGWWFFSICIFYRPLKSYAFYKILVFVVTGMWSVEWLDQPSQPPCGRFWVWTLLHSSELPLEYVENVACTLLFVIPGKMAKGIAKSSHVVRSRVILHNNVLGPTGSLVLCTFKSGTLWR